MAGPDVTLAELRVAVAHAFDFLWLQPARGVGQLAGLARQCATDLIF